MDINYIVTEEKKTLMSSSFLLVIVASDDGVWQLQESVWVNFWWIHSWIIRYKFEWPQLLHCSHWKYKLPCTRITSRTRNNKENVIYHWIEYSFTMDHSQGNLYEIIKRFRSIFEKDTIQFMQFKERKHTKKFSAILV